MDDNKRKWLLERDKLVHAIKVLGFPEELGVEIAKNLGSPKAMSRMTSYLYNVKPKKVEFVVDEMLAIKSEIEAWKKKKESEAANASITAYLNSDERLSDE